MRQARPEIVQLILELKTSQYSFFFFYLAMTFAQLSSQNRNIGIILQILVKNGSYIAMEEMLYIRETKTQQFFL